MTYEEYLSNSQQKGTTPLQPESAWVAAGRPAAGQSRGTDFSTAPGTTAAGGGTLAYRPLPETAQEMIPDELFYDPATKNWYGLGPDNNKFVVDPILAQQKYDAYRAKVRPATTQLPGQPAVLPWTPEAVPPWPGEKGPEEEFPLYGEDFQAWLRQIGKGKPAIPEKTYQPGEVFQFQGKTYQVDQNGNMREIGGAKTFDMANPPNGVKQYTDPYGKVNSWTLIDPTTGRYGYIETGYDPTKDASRGMTDYQKQQLELQKQGQETETTRLSYERGRDLATQAAEKERRLAELAARPINWLQYAAESKTPPVVQPWMMPLSQEQYGWKVGEPIPGVSMGTRAQTMGQEPQFFSDEERQRYANPPTTPAPAGQDWRFFAGQWKLRNQQGAMAGSETLPTTTQGMDFGGMGELLRPSAQLWARMGPDPQQQYYGYQQAQSGISPQQQEFFRQSTLPPGGRAPRWTWSR